MHANLKSILRPVLVKFDLRFLLALGGSTGSDVNDRNIAESRALGLDALLAASEVSCRANALEK